MVVVSPYFSFFVLFVSVCLFSNSNGFHIFRHSPRDMFYVDIFGDGRNEDEQIDFDSRFEENGIFSTDWPTTNAEKSSVIEGTSESITELISDKGEDSDFNSHMTLGPVSGENGIKSDSTITDTPDIISYHVTKMYLKAITSLIQHIIYSLFAFNDSPTKCDQQSIPDFESYDRRKIQKRQIDTKENLLSSSDEIKTGNKVSEGLVSSSDQILDMTVSESATADASVKDLSKHEESTLTDLSNSLNSVKYVSFENKNVDVDESTEPKLPISDHKAEESREDSATVTHKSSTTLLAMSTTEADKEKFGNKSGSKLEFKDPPMQDDMMIDIDELINEETKLNLPILADPITRWRDHSDYVHPREKKRSEKDSETASSNSGMVFIVTGTFLIIIVLVVAGAAVANVIRNRHLSRRQTANHNPSAQRTALA